MIIFCAVFVIIILILALLYNQVEAFSSPVYDQWHPTNYFQGEETINNKERYFDWFPYPKLYTKLNLGTWK